MIIWNLKFVYLWAREFVNFSAFITSGIVSAFARGGSECTPAQFPLYSSDFQIFVLNYTKAAFPMSGKKKINWGTFRIEAS